MSDPIRITSADLQRPEINDYVEMQKYLQRDVGEIGRQPWLIRVIYANWFYLAIASALGGFAAWACIEPWYDDAIRDPENLDPIDVLFFPIVTAGIGLFLGAAEGIMCRNLRRATLCGSMGLGIGFVGGLLAFLPSEIVFAIMSAIAVNVSPEVTEDNMPTGIGLLILMMGRASAWSVASIPAGVGQGIALKEKKVIINGVVGAVLGGLVGGLLFDPIYLLFLTEDGNAAISRAVGFSVIGLFVGLFVGLVEGWTKTAWLLMRKGPLAGKQFIMFKDTTVLGSSPKADIYLFKDDAIEPRHAIITNRGGRFEIEDCQTPDGTYVNGVAISRTTLSDGDQIVLGKTVLEFSVKESSKQR
ncbi:FHA domain-containing protein [Lacipirellula sp.]|uniref:FHA domain-containing protein n=1 Tax=Lacipirellula sp. TaxID=2691419 RepID=UPI003D0D440D